jgi:hypothetical protein
VHTSTLHEDRWQLTGEMPKSIASKTAIKSCYFLMFACLHSSDNTTTPSKPLNFFVCLSGRCPCASRLCLLLMFEAVCTRVWSAKLHVLYLLVSDVSLHQSAALSHTILANSEVSIERYFCLSLVRHALVLVGQGDAMMPCCCSLPSRMTPEVIAGGWVCASFRMTSLPSMSLHLALQVYFRTKHCVIRRSCDLPYINARAQRSTTPPTPIQTPISRNRREVI